MEYIEEELERIKNTKNELDGIIYACVLTLEDLIRKTVKDRWSKGESVDGGSITNKNTGSSSYARLSYKALKLEKNPKAGGRIDLTFTGSLGDRITLQKINSGDYEIISTDSKYQEIGSIYGFDEFGLNDAEMSYFMSILEKNINEKLQ